MNLFIWFLSAFALVLSYRKDKERTLRALDKGLNSFKKMLPAILGMIAIVGLTLATIPENILVTIFTIKGFWGFVLVSFIGAVVTIPGPIAFPLAGAFLKLGVHSATLATFITTLTMVGIASSPLEASYFGKRFTLLRQTFAFVAAIIIGLFMSIFL